MARDIKDLFKEELKLTEKMPENHQGRFLEKLDQVLPIKKALFPSWIKVAASILLVLGLSYGGFKYVQPEVIDMPKHSVVNNETNATKTLGDVSPGLKEVEDYYLASINLELAKMDPTPETKDLIDSFLEQLNILDIEYQRLSKELTNSGPTELTVNALIDNLKFRLNLLYRLRSQIENFGDTEADKTVEQSI
ncbi:hypothetical protein [Cognatitamlana onchidii]|uniref:hypothetical protein n=1 Tax=Cognatitamlana onchidii TaxID=2562860 RepID=UPI0010A5EA8E|nr:hypothetical protein [Algibacter onchidii]